MVDSFHSGPVTGQEFAAALQALAPDMPMAVAVSGGADSMALLRLAHAWATARMPSEDIIAFTFDHGLREASSREARQVAEWCAALGVRHRTLIWEGAKPRQGIQAAAREARYAALGAACLEMGAPSLLLGHQLEDQAETFLLRLGRGSGVYGLSAMTGQREWNGIRLLRPLLSFSRQRLQATLIDLNQPWLEDPSNADQRFARVRVRALLGQMEEAGISVARLAGTAKQMARARAVFEKLCADVMRSAVWWDRAGAASLNPDGILSQPEEIGLRVLAQVLTAAGGRDYPPRMQSLLQVYDWLGHKPVTGGKTLAGCQILPRRGRILVVREYAAIGAGIQLAPGAEAVWDNRFRVLLREVEDASDQVFTLRPIGDEGLRQLREKGMTYLMFSYLESRCLPGLWRGEELIAAPETFFPDPSRYRPRVRFEAIFQGQSIDLAESF